MPDPTAPAAPASIEHDAFRDDVLTGLAGEQKSIPCKYFYDERGSALFEQITETEEYYPTRTELAIMEADADEMAAAIGPRAVLIEYGSGSSRKTRVLLDRLTPPDVPPERALAAYVPIDISREHLHATAEALDAAYPGLPVLPVAADYTADFELPDLPPHEKRVVYFPGSTIGNFDRAQAADFLRHAAEVATGDDDAGGLLIGVDLVKDRATLEAAYDDAEGVTAAFNLNLLHRINRELDGTFDPDAFEHRAVWNDDERRIETYVVSTRDQTATVDGVTFDFAEGEAVHTENSHKYTVEGFADDAADAGFVLRQHWSDRGRLFSVLYFEVE